MFKFLACVLFLGAIVGEGYLLVTGATVGVWQQRAVPGEQVSLLGNRHLDYDALVCPQFDGKQLDVKVYRYSEDGLGGFVHCPLLVRSEGQA